MKCFICKHGETKLGKMTATLSRADTTVVIKEVPAEICDNCGEEYLSQEMSSYLFKIAESAVKSGIQVDVRKYIDTTNTFYPTNP